MKGIAAVAEILKREGVEYLFCFPYNSLIDACAAIGIRPILTRTERTLVSMADGYTRISNGRRTGVATVQQGPGVENAFSGVAQAYADAVPILFLPGQANQRRLGSAPNFDGVRNYAGVTKWAERINQPDRIAEFMRRAFTYVRMGRPGPVLLEVPQDVADAQVDDATFSYQPVRGARSLADPEAVREAVQLLLAAKEPIIHAGQAVLYAEASDELRELAELAEVPVLTTITGKGAFPENHPLALGTAANTATPMASHFLRDSDLVFGVGCSYSKAALAAAIPAGKTLLQIVNNEQDVNKDYAVDLALLGDVKLVLRQVIEEVKRQLGPAGRQGDGRVRGEIQTIKAAWLDKWMPRLTSDEVPINPYRVVWDLMHSVDRTQTIVTHDSGNPRDQILPFFETLVPRGYIGWGKSTQLGYSYGLSMGAKLAAPEKLVVNVMGDAAIGMVGMDIETAVRERIPILTIILNNSALGGYESHMPVASERYRTKFLSGNYAKVAEGLGAYSEQIDRPAEIVPAIRRAQQVVAGGRPAVLEMITREDPVFSK